MPELVSTGADLINLDYSEFKRERLTHYLFRYPAKFHPPVVKALLERYASPGMRLLDPFCGSGTCLVEAAVAGISATGTDVDPVAVFASKVKAQRYSIQNLRRSCTRVLKEVMRHERDSGEYERLMFEDLSNEEAAITEPGAYIPAIPKLYHWFRRYVVADLACILRVIHTAEIPRTHQDFLELCFASIIRAASNADPVPVSGLEVTAHMKRRDARGRLVNPFALFKRNVLRSLDDVEDFVAKASPVQIGAMQLDAAMVRQGLRGKFDIVVTSPPYNNAVDYYRRHQLETYWLGFTRSQAERIDLKRRYIGRPRISVAEREVLAGVTIGPLATTWYRKMFEVCPQRADAFKLYIASLGNSFRGVAAVLHRGAPVVCVVGHSRWRDEEIPLSDLLVEAAHSLRFEETLYYPVSNRYMSYTRRNGANIDREYAVVLRKR